MSDIPKVKAGQIWREVDPRAVRYIRVTRIGGLDNHRVRFESVIQRGSGTKPSVSFYWDRKPKTRESEAAIERFNGKRGGYELIGEPQ